MRHWLRRAAVVAAGVLGSLVLASVLFLTKPQTLLTSASVGALINTFGASYAPTWSSLTFSAAVLASRRHRYVLKAARVCVDDPEGLFSVCLTELELSLVMFYSRRGPVIERVERFVAVAEKARLDLRRRSASGARDGFALPAPIESLRLEASHFEVQSASAAITGRFRAALTPGETRPLSVAGDVWIRDASGARRLKASLAADTDLHKGGSPTYIDLVVRADYGPRGGRAFGRFRARREPRRYAGTGSLEVSASTGPLSALRLSSCEVYAPLSSPTAGPSRVDLTCRYEMVPADPETFGHRKSAGGGVSMNAQRVGDRFMASLKADVDPITSWYELRGDVAVEISGRLGRALASAKMKHAVRVAAKVPRFEEMVGFLRSTRFAVPAPIHVLSGPLTLALTAEGDPRSEKLKLRYVLSSSLAATRQRLIARAAGDLTVARPRGPGRSFDHTGEVLLKEVALELPRLDIGRNPKFTVDKRIKSGDAEPLAVPAQPAPPAPPALALRSRVVVRTESPVILFSNLAKDPIPVTLELVETYPPAAVGGAIGIRKFDIELFRRNATIDHINIALSSGSSIGTLEGLVLYKTPSALINILLLGTTEKPRVEFTSVPPMKRQDIISLLIFGKSPEELDTGQTASVGNTETALESRAFGLASLYLFGATPIEHVGYDSATKTTSVKLRLPGGANLTLGSDFDQSRQLSVRKPLAPHWAIQSEVSSQRQQSSAAATFLEWFNRY